MHLILVSSLLLLGALANGHETDPDGKLLNQMVQEVDELKKKVAYISNAFGTVHKARSFGSGSERLYVTNKQEATFDTVNSTCIIAGGHIPSPQLENENKAFASVLERHNKPAYLEVHKGAKFTNWAKGEPEITNRTMECVAADTHGFWYTVPCDEEMMVVCEFSFI